jgi:SAM-dependent methyltransferase
MAVYKENEGFKPIKNEPPTNFINKIKFYGRMILDLQILTIFNDVKKELPTYRGVILDIGCGQSPYRYLLNRVDTTYKGIDVAQAEDFDYINNDITVFDGKNIPFADDTFDAVICTEVMEHVYEHQALVDEIYRVCKPGAKGILTIPFSARYHYIPYDYYRYTPSALEHIFNKFSVVEIAPRGTDVVSICAKIIVLYFRNCIPNSLIKFLFFPLLILTLPFLVITVIVAHISLIFRLGSDLDPLGYTIKIVK